MNNRGDIAVGYDGSKGVKRAVEFAAAEAAAHHASLRIFTVWNSSPPAVAVMSGVTVPVIAADRARLAEQRLDEAAALAREVAADIDIQTVALEGNPGGARPRVREQPLTRRRLPRRRRHSRSSARFGQPPVHAARSLPRARRSAARERPTAAGPQHRGLTYRFAGSERA